MFFTCQKSIASNRVVSTKTKMLPLLNHPRNRYVNRAAERKPKWKINTVGCELCSKTPAIMPFPSAMVAGSAFGLKLVSFIISGLLLIIIKFI